MRESKTDLQERKLRGNYKAAKSKREKSTSSKEFSLQLYQEGLQQLSVWISELAGSI
jgi:negative regulator of sigma E activity